LLQTDNWNSTALSLMGMYGAAAIVSTIGVLHYPAAASRTVTGIVINLGGVAAQIYNYFKNYSAGLIGMISSS